MNVFFTADWHLGHRRIIELAGRPFASVEEMNDEIVRRHNERVSEGDVVWVLGDAVMGPFAESLEWVSRMNGRLMLVPGNHDRVSPAYHHAGDRAAKVERFRQMYLDAGFERVLEEDPTLELSGFGDLGLLEVQLSHFPYEAEDERDQRYNELRPRDRGLPLVHGHVHTAWRENGRELNVGVDVWDFRPVPVERVCQWVGTLWT